MPPLRKRKESLEKSSLHKRKKVSHEVEDSNPKISSNSNYGIKVENEFGNLFEEEADLTIEEDLDLFRKDLDNFGIRSLSKTKCSLNDNCEVVAASVSNENNKSSSAKNSATVSKIIVKHREALKLLHAALMKFENVTKDLQELVQYDIQEAQTDMESEMNSSIDSLHISSVEGQSSIFEDPKPKNLQVQDKAVDKNVESTSSVTKSSPVQNQPKDPINNIPFSDEKEKWTSGLTLPENSAILKPQEDKEKERTDFNPKQNVSKAVSNELKNKFNHGTDSSTPPSFYSSSSTTSETRVDNVKEKEKTDCDSRRNVSSAVSSELKSQKIENLKKSCISQQNTSAKLPYVVVNNVMDETTVIPASIKSEYETHIERGRCNEIACSCLEYEVGSVGSLCTYCGHAPTLHEETIEIKPAIENLKQENDLLEETISEDIERGRCNEFACPCLEYEVESAGSLCTYCGHAPTLHAEMTELRPVAENFTQDKDPLEEEKFEDTPSTSGIQNSQQIKTNDNESNVWVSSNLVSHEASQFITEDMSPSDCNLALSEQSTFEDSSGGSNIFTSLPSFSDFVLPYLSGQNMPSKQQKSMRNIVIETLIEFLDKNNLLNGTSKIHQALGYRALGRTLLQKYPKIHREECTSKRRRKEELGFLMSRLADRRRVRKRRESQRERPSNISKNGEDALSYFQNFTRECSNMGKLP